MPVKRVTFQVAEIFFCTSRVFLHGWRRYARREAQVTLIELNGERYEPSNRPRTNHNRQNPTENSGRLREPKQNNVKSGETGQ